MSQLTPSDSSVSLPPERNFKDFFKGYLEYTANHESTKKVKLWSAISIVAAAMERKVFLNRGYYTLFPNLYTFIIGKSGLIKKSTSTAIAVDLLRSLPKIKIMSDRLTAGSLIQQLHLSGNKYAINGEMFNQTAVFSYASELSVFLEEVFGNITQLLTTLYDCVPHDSSKPWIYNTVGRGELRIYGPCLNILGASTKAWLKKCIPRSEIEGGFTSRIMFVVEDELPEILVAWPSIDSSMKAKKEQLVHDLTMIHSLTGEFSVSPEGRAWFQVWYEKHMRKVVPLNSDPRMAGYMSRKPDHILKLSMIRSVSKSNAMLISLEDMHWGLDSLDELEKHWRGAFEGAFVITEGNLQFEIKKYIMEMNAVRNVDLLANFKNRASGKEIQVALNALINMGDAVQGVHPGTGEKLLTYPGAGIELS